MGHFHVIRKALKIGSMSHHARLPQPEQTEWLMCRRLSARVTAGGRSQFTVIGPQIQKIPITGNQTQGFRLCSHVHISSDTTVNLKQRQLYIDLLT